MLRPVNSIFSLVPPFLAAVFFLLANSSLWAQPPMGAPAMAACKGQRSGASCAFQTPHGKRYGSCQMLPYQGQGVCVPENAGAGESGHPPRGEQNLRGGEGMMPGARQHSVLQSDGKPFLTPSMSRAPVRGYLEMEIEGESRVLKANGVPSHTVGRFPNSGNPHSIKPQSYRFRIPLNPELSARATPLNMRDFGLALNGVPFDPAAAEWYRGQPGSEWQYEALSGAVSLGIDDNYAHVQPTGAYHYHGLPRELLQELEVSPGKHSPLIGWAADGFPIYALYGYVDSLDAASGIRTLRSSWRLKKGQRPYDRNTPGGYHDGTFTADYVFERGRGELDECNGRFTLTPEFPLGTYAYFLTEDWPVIPRCWKGTPSADFDRKGGRRP